MVKTILITGSNGFIGSSLVKNLGPNPNLQIIGVSRGANRVSALDDRHYYNSDITKKSDLETVFSKVKPDVVVHCAAISQVDICESDPNLCDEVNVKATELITSECKKLNTRLIFLSSDFVFDGTLRYVEEDTIPNPISVYGKSKRKSEIFIESNLNNWAIVRPVLVYGFSSSASRSNIFSWVYGSLLEGVSIVVVNDQFRTPTFIDDVVLLLDHLVKGTSTGYYNIGGANLVSVFQFAKEVARCSGFSESLIVEGNSNDVKGAHLRPSSSCFQIQRIVSELSIKPLNCTEGIEKSILQIKG
jgi:dTDP-4-dehydrorhamnose reductase